MEIEITKKNAKKRQLRTSKTFTKKRRLNTSKNLSRFAFEKKLLKSGLTFLGSKLKDVYSLIPNISRQKNSNSNNSNNSNNSKHNISKKYEKNSDKKKNSSLKISDKKSSLKISGKKLSLKISRKNSTKKKKKLSKKILKTLLFSSHTTTMGVPILADGFSKGTTKWEMSYNVNFNKPNKKRTHNIWIIQNITLTLKIKSNPNKFTINDIKKNINKQWDPIVFTKNNKNINEDEFAKGVYNAIYTELFMYNKSPNKLDKSGYKDMFPVNPWMFSSSQKQINHKGELDYSVHGEIFQVPDTTIGSYNLGKFNPAGELKARLGHIDKSNALGGIRTRFVEYNIIDNHIKKIKLMGSNKKIVSFKDTDKINIGDIPLIEPLDLVY